MLQIVRAFLVLLATSGAAFASSEEKRFALVIGNSNYKLSPLPNPQNDADDLADALRRLQFDVRKRTDLTTTQFDDVLEQFIVDASSADVVFFYFSGHGLQIDKRGYLVPVDFRGGSEDAAFRQLVAVQSTISRIERLAKIAIVVIDACRDSPLPGYVRRSDTTGRSLIEPPKGLPAVSVVGSNTLVVYATAPGEVASDGPGERNSPFTKALLRNIETPDLEVELMFKRVTARVLEATAGRQQPERLSRLQQEFFLLRDTQQEQLWSSVKDAAEPDKLRLYLEKYPDGRFSEIARALIKQFELQRALELAAREEERRRVEAVKKAEQVRMLEEELRARERVLAERKDRANVPTTDPPASTAETNKVPERKQEISRAEATDFDDEAKRADGLRKAQDAARAAEEVAREAEKQRIAAANAADEAKRKAEAIRKEKELEGEKIAVGPLPRPNQPKEGTTQRPKPEILEDARAASHKIWKQGAIARGETVSARVGNRTLVCVGGSGYHSNGTRDSTAPLSGRRCHWQK